MSLYLGNNLIAGTSAKVPQLTDLGLTASKTELNYVDGVTSSIQNQLDSKLPSANIKSFKNVTVNANSWVSNTTYADYPFRASIALSNITQNHYPEVTFAVADATSGNFAPVAESYAGGIYIYAKEKLSAAITIPAIVCILGV